MNLIAPIDRVRLQAARHARVTAQRKYHQSKDELRADVVRLGLWSSLKALLPFTKKEPPENAPSPVPVAPVASRSSNLGRGSSVVGGSSYVKPATPLPKPDAKRGSKPIGTYKEPSKPPNATPKLPTPGLGKGSQVVKGFVPHPKPLPSTRTAEAESGEGTNAGTPDSLAQSLMRSYRGDGIPRTSATVEERESVVDGHKFLHTTERGKPGEPTEPFRNYTISKVQGLNRSRLHASGTRFHCRPLGDDKSTSLVARLSAALTKGGK